MKKPEWTAAHCDAARREGWGLFLMDGAPVLQRHDEAGLLASDDEARALVYERALRGSALHLTAARICLRLKPCE